MKIEENFSLKALNTFGVDVKSRYFVNITDISMVTEIPLLPKPHLFLGSGSNILFTQDFDGTVILNSLKGVEILAENAEHVRLKVMGGEIWHDFVVRMNQLGYHGLEYLALIPGTVGASPVQNIGAYGAEVRQYIRKVNVYDCHEHAFKTFDNEACEFSYRDSLFKREQSRYWIISVEFELLKEVAVSLTYRALLDYFKNAGSTIDSLTMNDVLHAVIDVRSSKLPDPKIIGNAGSFFKNPIVTEDKALQLKAEFAQLVTYPQDGGNFKLAAGQLIELSGFKGRYEGAVGMYEKQALVLVNLGGGTGSQLVSHAQKVQEGVNAKFKVVLEAEPLIL